MKELFAKQFSDGKDMVSGSNHAPAFLKEIRQTAFESFMASKLPTMDDEGWRYTSIDSLVKLPFDLVRSDVRPAWLTPSYIDSLAFSPDEIRLVFLNGRFVANVSTPPSPYPLPPHNRGTCPQGERAVMIKTLSQAMKENTELVEAHLGRVAPTKDHLFTSLNTAFIEEGAFIFIPRGVVLEKPIHLCFISDGGESPPVSQPRILVVAEELSRAVLVENYVGKSRYFTNPVTEIVLGKEAHIEHCKLQEESESGFHIATVKARQERASRLTSYSISLGSHLCRNEIGSVLADEGAETTLNGLYLARGHQHVDHQTEMDHAKPHGTSHQVYKGILADHAQGVFNGRVVVRPDAQKTNAHQLNRNLLLSENAVINTKPLLEIFNNDVKCTHGATIGRLDDKQLFYLRSRGLSETYARNLLIYAFANDLVSGMQPVAFKEKFQQLLFDRLMKGWFSGVSL